MADESYRRAAWIYRGAGWAGALPLPSRGKWPPPRGYTGWAGVEPSGADVQAWADGPEGDGNICLHLPEGVYGLDVDEYGPKSGGSALHRLTDLLGALPPTWIASSRGESLSGIRLFRAALPAGRRWRNEPAGRGAGIESIHRGHRYAVVWPSWHPEGRQYLWRRPEGILAAEGEVPHIADLPMLPDAWVAELSEPGEARVGDMAGHHESIETVTGWRDGDACPRVAAAYDRATLALASARDGAELHPTATSQVFELVNLGHEGHAGVRAALATHYGLFVEIRSEREGTGATGRSKAEDEWWRMVRGAVGKLHAGARRETCDCGLWRGEGVYFEGPPTWAPAWLENAPAAITAGVTAGPTGVGDPMPAGEADERIVEAQVLDPVEVMRSYLLTSSQIAEREPPRPLVAGLLYLDTLAWLIGRSGSFKSFVALDLAQAVGHGRPWAGRRVRQGPVLYIVAEGAGGMSLRTRAWRQTYGPLSDAVHFLPHPVQVNSEAWGVLVQLAATLDPALIVVDTQARVTVGVKENDNTEMGRFIEQIDRLRRATRACVLIVHHIGRQGEDARGASAIDGAQDTELKVSRVGGDKAMRAQLKIDKQKDGPDTAVVDLELRPVDLGDLDDNGEPLTSLVVSTDVFITPTIAPWREGLPDRQRMIIDILDEMFSTDGGTRAEVMGVIRERNGGAGRWARSSFYAAWDKLRDDGRIERVEGTQRFLVIMPTVIPDRSSSSNPFTGSEINDLSKTHDQLARSKTENWKQDKTDTGK